MKLLSVILAQTLAKLYAETQVTSINRAILVSVGAAIGASMDEGHKRINDCRGQEVAAEGYELATNCRFCEKLD